MIKHDQLERWVFFNLQVQMASPSPSLSRWRRWEEPCGCWATRTDRLVFPRSELLLFFIATVPRRFLQQFPGVFHHGDVCKFPVIFLQWFRPVFYCNGWLVVVVVACWLRKKHAAQATSCAHTSSRSLVPWAEPFFPKTGGTMSHFQAHPDQRCRELKILLVSFWPEYWGIIGL